MGRIMYSHTKTGLFRNVSNTTMELTAEIVTALKAVHLFCKNFHLDV